MSRHPLCERISVPEVLQDIFEIEVPGRLPAHIPCWLHDESQPSLCIYEDHWFCYGCGRGGDVIGLVMAGGKTYRQAVMLLEAYAEGHPEGVRVQQSTREVVDFTERFWREANDEQPGLAVNFITERWPHLSYDWLRQFGVRASRWNLLIPHYDLQGRIVGVKTRALYGGEKGKKSAFKGSTFTARLYGDAGPLARPNGLVLTEGESDCWTMTWATHAHDVQVLSLPSGVNAWRDDWIEAHGLDRRPVIWLALDNDTAGHEATDRLLRRLPNARVLEHPEGDVTEAYLAGWRPALT